MTEGRSALQRRDLRRANSVLRQNSAEHGLNPDALILSTAGLSASGLDWELLGLGPDYTGLLRLLPPSSHSEDSVGLGPPATEVSELPSKASLGSGSPNEGSTEHSFIRPLSDLSADVSVSGSDSGGLFDDEPAEDTPHKHKRLRQNAVKPTSFKLPAARRLGRPSVDLKGKRRPLPYLRRLARATRGTPISADGLSPAKNPRSPSRPTLEEGEIADDAGSGLDTEAPVGGASAQSSPISGVRVTATSGQSQTTATGAVSSKSVVEILDLTCDDVTASSSKKDSSPFSSPVVSYFPRKDGRPCRSTSVASELRMRESLERELADDDFMLGLTSEGSMAKTSTPSRSTTQPAIAPIGVAESSIEESVAISSEGSSVETPGGGAAG
ncbi:LOW QUALITY PROTEIN: hypothetical protein PHMEG_00019678 [Phytophthora megakarya]|uniref:Uncharacterized protein n=1 Tax=Phytophthora megakarya TaxID=4795 RepID=A0A225VTL0_9STRA|nr:LOW QUALITY PROTEIN: hypothetical protein PHMEG_00019678 [Phytophthora megakarya]